MIKIVPRKNENLESMLRRFRKTVEREGVLKELRKREFYEKPSDRKRRLKRKAERRTKQSDISKQQHKKQMKKNDT